MERKRSNAVIALICAVLIIGVAAILWGVVFNPEFYGLYKIKQASVGDGEYGVSIHCTEFSEYSVRLLSPDTEIYKGEGKVTLNSELGEYITEVKISDAEVSERFYRTYEPWETYKISDGLNFMYAYHAEHGFSVYIGSDKPIDDGNIKIVGIEY